MVLLLLPQSGERLEQAARSRSTFLAAGHKADVILVTAQWLLPPTCSGKGGAPCLPAGKKADVLLVTALDEVAWLLNLRGGDVAHNPVFLAYVMVTEKDATLYVDQKKVKHPSGQLLCARPHCCPLQRPW